MLLDKQSMNIYGEETKDIKIVCKKHTCSKGKDVTA